MNRHEEACELIWMRLKDAKSSVSNVMEARAVLDDIEQILVQTESLVEEEKEQEFKAFLSDQAKAKKPSFCHV
jgi:hypothetical protein